MAHILWTESPEGIALVGQAAGDLRAEIWRPSWAGRRRDDLVVKLVVPGRRAEYSAAPTVEAAKARAEELLAEGERTS